MNLCTNSVSKEIFVHLQYRFIGWNNVQKDKKGGVNGTIQNKKKHVSYCDWRVLTLSQLAIVLAVSLLAAVFHQLALQYITELLESNILRRHRGEFRCATLWCDQVWSVYLVYISVFLFPKITDGFQPNYPLPNYLHNNTGVKWFGHESEYICRTSL